MYPIKALLEETKDITMYWYNPNIHPEFEWNRRLENLNKVSEHYCLELITEDGFMQDYWESKAYMEEYKSRCEMCYDVRLDMAAKYASLNGFDSFTTTLLVSPYQQHEVITRVANEKASKYGVERRISTSHIASYNFNLKLLFRKFGQWYGNKYTTHRLACGEEAGKLLYGDLPFEIFNNAIDTKTFVYDEKAALHFKQERGWINKIVIGNVARFCPQKNHHGMIDIFEAIHKKNKDTVLVLVGEGVLMPEIKELVQQKGLQESVCFEGIRNNVPEYLNAFDIFLFPSLYEGLPVSIIEAQAAGLRCLLSDTIDKATDITGDITFVPLSASPEMWATQLFEQIPYHRPDNSQKIIDAGYDVSQNVETLIRIYLG